jgi:hypothetical protein
LRNSLIVAAVLILLMIIAIFLGVKYSAESWNDFWKTFMPSLLANAIGVSVAVIAGIPVGFMINHLVAGHAETRRVHRQIGEVRELLEQVRMELSLHATPLIRITQSFSNIKAATTNNLQPTAPTATPSAVDFSQMMLRDVAGKMFIENPNVISVGESSLLFRVGSYYSRAAELSNLLTWRIQSPKSPESWDRRIEDLGNSLGLDRLHLDYEVQQAVTRLTGRGN